MLPGIDPCEVIQGYRVPVTGAYSVPAPDRNAVHGGEVYLRYGIFCIDRYCHDPPC